MFYLPLRYVENVIRREESSSSISKGLPVSRHRSTSCKLLAGPARLGLV